jgi:serpin B
MRRMLAAAVLAALLPLTACGTTSSATGDGDPSPAGSDAGGGRNSTSSDAGLTVSKSAVARDPASATVDPTANNAFATDLFSRVAAGQTNANVFTSPVSASLALTMAYAGAKGDTAAQMAKALHFDPTSDVFGQQNALTQELATLGPQAFAAATRSATDGPSGAPPSADDFRLDVVNAVWGQKGVAWTSPFLDVLARDYGAGITLADFMSAPDDVRQTINAWVSDETADKINDLLPQGSVDSATRMTIVNAIHLKFPWAYAFDPSLTAPAAFTRPDGATVQANFMAQRNGATFDYDDDGKAQIVWLPIGGLNVVLAMPHGDLATYEAALAADPSLLFTTVGGNEVLVHVPKVTFTSASVSLSETLQAMGMTDAFDPRVADFSGMDGARDLSVQDVLQKTTLALDETGIEAAAATTVFLGGGTTPPPDIHFDHPFVIAIVDPTRTILFLGHVADPTQGS